MPRGWQFVKKKVGVTMVNQWGTIGISSENRFLELYFEPGSEQFLAHFYKGLGNGYGVKSLYARHFTDETYRKITPESENLTFEDVVFSTEHSKILVNVFKVRKRGNKYTGYDWHSVDVIDTDTGEVEEIFTTENMDIPEPYVKASIIQLRSVKEDGNELICTIAFEKKPKGGETAIDYYLSKIMLKSGKHKMITKLSSQSAEILKYKERISGKSL